ncbi:MAG TPA: hypothetical protein VHE30_00965 [Polyangiaceae bacterium]|nr:hypothetical protein [Polyangiaceae bacterium]
MRYSVVLPRKEPTDPDAVRGALDQAVRDWDRGDQSAALAAVRGAAEAARVAGNASRAESLERAAGSLSVAMEDEHRAKKPEAPRSGSPPVASSRSGSMKAAGSGSMKASSRSSGGLPKVSGKAPPLPSRRSGALSTASSASASGALSVAARAAKTTAPAPAEEELVPRDLLVTLTPADGGPPEGSLVGHAAVRVAIAPGRGPGGTVMIRPLAPGEIAPRGSPIALLVALEPGADPIPKAGA